MVMLRFASQTSILLLNHTSVLPVLSLICLHNRDPRKQCSIGGPAWLPSLDHLVTVAIGGHCLERFEVNKIHLSEKTSDG